MIDEPYPAPESADRVAAATPNPGLAFDPVEVRARVDGWTPDRQREFVEALADCGVAREAAARVGMSEQSVARLRRRGDAGSFAAACKVAVRIATRRLRPIAFERAVEGTIKRHYYHGELKAEERVYDNRLLRYLLEKTGLLCDPGNHVATAEKRWPALLDSIELGGSPEPAASAAKDEVWEVDGRLWTGFPPPPGFRGTEDGAFGDALYRRSLTKPERAAFVAQDEKDVDRCHALASLRRDRFFGFEAARSTG